MFAFPLIQSLTRELRRRLYAIAIRVIWQLARLLFAFAGATKEIMLEANIDT
jgi:hypothetical protein